MHTVAVLGLGQMGSTLAKLLLEKHLSVRVWNRNPAKAEALGRAGALVAGSALDAVAGAEAVVMCVHDYRAAQEILAGPGVLAALKGKLLVQLSTGSPEEVRQAAAGAREGGFGYLDGAIQVAPEQMGKPDTTILIAGSRAHYERAAGLLAAFGGNMVYLGDDAAAAAVMDLATLSYVYGAALGFIQGAALARAEGLDVARYGAIIEAMSASTGAFLRHEAGVVASGDYRISQSPMSISVEATARIEQAMRARGLRPDLPAAIARLLALADEAGYGGEEFAAMVKVLEPAGAGARGAGTQGASGGSAS